MKETLRGWAGCKRRGSERQSLINFEELTESAAKHNPRYNSIIQHHVKLSLKKTEGAYTVFRTSRNDKACDGWETERFGIFRPGRTFHSLSGFRLSVKLVTSNLIDLVTSQHDPSPITF